MEVDCNTTDHTKGRQLSRSDSMWSAHVVSPLQVSWLCTMHTNPSYNLTTKALSTTLGFGMRASPGAGLCADAKGFDKGSSPETTVLSTAPCIAFTDWYNCLRHMHRLRSSQHSTCGRMHQVTVSQLFHVLSLAVAASWPHTVSSEYATPPSTPWLHWNHYVTCHRGVCVTAALPPPPSPSLHWGECR
jgi:hypothetical protein